MERPEYFFEQEIIDKHRHLSFQHPDKIADALSLIWEEKQKWQKIATNLNKPDKEIRERLKRIVDRRNQIAHEADINIQTQARQDIDRDDVVEAVEFILLLGSTIFDELTHTDSQSGNL